MLFIRTINAEKVRKHCIEHNYYTCGNMSISSCIGWNLSQLMTGRLWKLKGQTDMMSVMNFARRKMYE